jgi:hypothetical protein
MATEIFYHLNDWDVVSNVTAMGFDTTSSNTGSKNGACHLLEQKIGRNLLHLACRHHIHELMVAATFKLIFGNTTSPQPTLFLSFQTAWPSINKSNFRPIDQKSFKKPLLQNLRTDVLSFLDELLTSSNAFPRDDYRELAELCMILLGSPLTSNLTFKKCGACHHARWMSKIVYCFKIYLFRFEYQLPRKDEKKLKRLCLFYALVYVKAWFSAPIPSDAPINDLKLYKQLLNYKNIDTTIADTALEKLRKHFWYISPELVPLALFSKKVSIEDKKKIQRAILKYGDFLLQ